MREEGGGAIEEAEGFVEVMGLGSGQRGVGQRGGRSEDFGFGSVEDDAVRGAECSKTREEPGCRSVV